MTLRFFDTQLWGLLSGAVLATILQDHTFSDFNYRIRGSGGGGAGSGWIHAGCASQTRVYTQACRCPRGSRRSGRSRESISPQSARGEGGALES